MSGDENAPHLVIVGGGLTGAALALHAVRAGAGPLTIEVIEPAAELGRGVAYATADPVHRINVPSHRMSLFGDDPEHFTRWLFLHGILPDPASTDEKGDHYVGRAAFGAYMSDMLARTSATAGPDVVVRNRRARATSITAAGAGWRVALDDGHEIRADGVALCPGHPAPVLPCPVSDEALRHPGFVGNPWRPHAFAPIGTYDDVLIVGTGLTMLDAVASLERAGHRGPVTALSRRGLLARPQGSFPDGYDLFANAPLPRTALDLLRLLRLRLHALGPETDWQAVVDAFRFRLRPMWSGLSPHEQRRVVRHLLPFWEVHRFRAAPQPFALAGALRDAGRLRIERAGLAGLDAEAGRLVASLRRAGSTERRSVDAVVLCTGPGHALRTDALVGDLVRRGLARPDSVGLGLAVDADSRLAAGRGGHHDTLWAFGPVTRGSFGEMTGEPDIVRHVTRIVPGLLDALTAARAPDAMARRWAAVHWPEARDDLPRRVP